MLSDPFRTLHWKRAIWTTEMLPKGSAWTNRELETFLCILGEEDVQRELHGSVRNAKVFQLVSDKLLDAGFERNTEQCRQKSKKLRVEYRKVKEQNNRSGDKGKTWKWFNMMDAIYGHQLESKGEEIDTATSLLESKLEPIGKCKCPTSAILYFSN